MYHCISLSRKYPKGNVAEKELHHEGREESLKEAFVIIVIIINGKEFGRTHQFQGTREYRGTTSSSGSSPPFPSHCSASKSTSNIHRHHGDLETNLWLMNSIEKPGIWIKRAKV